MILIWCQYAKAFKSLKIGTELVIMIFIYTGYLFQLIKAVINRGPSCKANIYVSFRYMLYYYYQPYIYSKTRDTPSSQQMHSWLRHRGCFYLHFHLRKYLINWHELPIHNPLKGRSSYWTQERRSATQQNWRLAKEGSQGIQSSQESSFITEGMFMIHKYTILKYVWLIN